MEFLDLFFELRELIRNKLGVDHRAFLRRTCKQLYQEERLFSLPRALLPYCVNCHMTHWLEQPGHPVESWYAMVEDLYAMKLDPAWGTRNPFSNVVLCRVYFPGEAMSLKTSIPGPASYLWFGRITWKTERFLNYHLIMERCHLERRIYWVLYCEKDRVDEDHLLHRLMKRCPIEFRDFTSL